MMDVNGTLFIVPDRRFDNISVPVALPADYTLLLYQGS